MKNCLNLSHTDRKKPKAHAFSASFVSIFYGRSCILAHYDNYFALFDNRKTCI